MNQHYTFSAFGLWRDAAGISEDQADRDLRDAATDAIQKLIPDSENFTVVGSHADATLLVGTDDALFTLKRGEGDQVRVRRLPLAGSREVEVARAYSLHQNGYREQVSTWTFGFEGADPITFTTRREANEGASGAEAFARGLASSLGWEIA